MALSLNTPFLRTAIPTLSRTTSRRLSVPIKVECKKKVSNPKTPKKKVPEPTPLEPPPFFEDAKVFCDGEMVMVTSGTQKEYTVDTWSGNHPFYLGEITGFDEDYEDMDPGAYAGDD